MEAVACGRRDSLIHASVGKQRRYHLPKPYVIQGATCLGALSIALKSLVFLNVVLSLASSWRILGFSDLKVPTKGLSLEGTWQPMRMWQQLLQSWRRRFWRITTLPRSDLPTLKDLVVQVHENLVQITCPWCVVFILSIDSSWWLPIAFLSGVVGVSLDKHVGEYTLGEILFGKFFKLNLGR